MSWDAWYTLLVVGGVLVALARNWWPPDQLFLTALLLLVVPGVITPKVAFEGFSNPGMLTVAFLFVVAAGMRETGLLERFGQRVLGKATNERSALARLAMVLLPMSAFLNNTPVVAMFVPVVMNWCRRARISPSRLLIPLSYLTILGGTCTLIGTSTNLVINGLLETNGLPGMGLFEIGKIGVPYAIVGVVYLFTLGSRWLPDRKELLEQLGESRREFLVEMLVQPNCGLIGQTIEQAGLRHLPGLFLVEIDRGDKLISPVNPDELIRVNDRMIFTGVVSSIVELEKIPGFIPAVDPSYEFRPHQQRQRRLCEAVISSNSPLIGKTIREADFRALYGAAVLAVHRGGSRLVRKPGDIRLLAGDTLLLQTQPHFQRAYRNDPSFYLISDVAEWTPLRSDRLWIALAVFCVLLVAMTADLVPTVVAAGLAAVAVIGLGCISAGDARKSIEWQVLITISAAFGIGAALEKSGAAAAVVQVVFGSIEHLGPIAALATIYILGSLVTELITNNAAAALMFPFCLQTAKLYDVSPMPFVIALMLSASASFMTPIGYQTNMMVYGPGGYRFTDFVKIGTPLNIVLAVVAIALVPILWPFAH